MGLCEKCVRKVNNLTSYTERKLRLTERLCINVKTDTVQKFIQFNSVATLFKICQPAQPKTSAAGWKSLKMKN